MPVITLLIALVILILLIINHTAIKFTLNQLKFEINQLRFELQRVSKISDEVKKESESATEAVFEAKEDSEILIQKYGPKSESATKIPEIKQEIIPEEPISLTINPEIIETEKEVNLVIEQKIWHEQPKITKGKSTDIEKFIGENLMSKIGIIILVLGIGYFVKYAIDKNWIGEYGRVAIGVLTGGIIITVAHLLRKTYRTFSSTLTGGGLAVFYITISLAFHQYHLFSQAIAFTILIFITIFSVLLSLAYDKKELAIFSQLGGFAVPFMVSTGEGNYVVLFSYLLILNIGIIAISYYKRWHVVNIIAFIGTVLVYSGWLIQQFVFKSNPPYGGALLFGSLFYLIFFVLNILNAIKERKPFNGIEISMILSNNLFFLASGLTILYQFHGGAFKGIFTLAMGIYNLIWVFVLYKRKNIDKTLLFLLIGLVLSLVSLAVPIQLSGHSITLFWSAELIILLWLSQKSNISILKSGHLLLVLLVIISILMDWQKIYFDSYAIIIPVIFNKAFITGLVVVISLAFTRYLLNNESEEHTFGSIFSLSQYKNVINSLLFIGIYLVGFLELWYQMNQFYAESSFRNTIYGIYNFSYISIALFVVSKLALVKARLIFTYISLGTLLIFLIFYIGQIVSMRNAFIYENSLTLFNYSLHYLIYIPIIYLLYYIGTNRNTLFKTNSSFPAIILWFFSLLAVVTLSIELDNITLVSLPRPVNYEIYHQTIKQVHMAGYPILWGVCAFVLMIAGMKISNKAFRVQSITLLSIIILKLIFIDVWKMSEGGRIASFIFLGVVLIVISFLYQKLKKLVLSDIETPEKETEI